MTIAHLGERGFSPASFTAAVTSTARPGRSRANGRSRRIAGRACRSRRAWASFHRRSTKGRRRRRRRSRAASGSSSGMRSDRRPRPTSSSSSQACLAMRGQFDDARAQVARARETFDELGQLGPPAALCGGVGGAIEVLAGDWQAAELVLLESCELLERARLNSTFATRAGELAAAIYEQGDSRRPTPGRAPRRTAAAEDDLDARLAWEPVRAKLLARGGEHDRAQRTARVAGRRWRRARMRSTNVRACFSISRTSCASPAARRDGRSSSNGRSAMYQQKGNLAGADRIGRSRFGLSRRAFLADALRLACA